MFGRFLLGLVLGAIAPVTDSTAIDRALGLYQLHAFVLRLLPTTLYSEASSVLLNPSLTGTSTPATLGQLTQVQQQIPTLLSLDQSLLLVWPHVVAFREIPVPDDWLFRVGVAYPIRARIDGTGVGAMRYCVFSTGSFVEPITRWEVGRRLSFDVIESPATMTELSPYRNLSPRHLHGYLRSRRGEFRFVDLGDGRTRLEGSTWYEIEMAPEGYWQMFSDMLIHRIHQRVLDHIKREVETERRHGSE